MFKGLNAVKTRYPLCGRLGAPRCRPGRVRKISTAPAFVLQTSRTVTSCRTDCAIAAANEYGLLSSWKNIAVKMRMMVVFCRHMRVLRALSFFANVPYEMCLFVIRFTRGGLRKEKQHYGENYIMSWRWPGCGASMGGTKNAQINSGKKVSWKM